MHLSDEPLVSVICTAYNHEKYIRYALNGFIMQETTFPFEVIIHDDASTDSTADIIREYEEKFPNIIKPIYQKENQYSKKVRITKDILLPKVKGKYIALCEGDDFWIDKHKLQKQVDYLEKYADCSFTFHPAHIVVNEKSNENTRYWDKELDFDAEKIIAVTGGGYGIAVPTASMCFKTDIALKFPKFREIAPVGDLPLQILLSLNGFAHYFPDIMACYRLGHEGSWTAKRENDKEFDAKNCINVIKMFAELNRYTEGVYQKIISHRIFAYMQGLRKLGMLQMDPTIYKIYAELEQNMRKYQESLIDNIVAKLADY